jgi:muramidase (phage lysozyme)
MPTNSNASIVHNGIYKVCVRLTDLAGNTPIYGWTLTAATPPALATFRALTVLPTCTSVSRINLAADGYISSTDFSATTAIAAATAAGLQGETNTVVAGSTQFAVIDNTAGCDQSQIFNSAIPTSGHSKFTSFKNHPQVIHCQSGYCSDAAGRYQFLSGTWKAVSKKHKLKDFSPKNQDLAAIEKIKERGAYQLIVNDLPEKAIYKLSKEWSSFPAKNGKSYYSQPSRKIDKLVNFYEERVEKYLLE